MENKHKVMTCFTLLWGMVYFSIGSLQVLKGVELLPDDCISTNLLPP